MEIWDVDCDLDNIWTYSDSDKAVFKICLKSEDIDLIEVFDEERVGSYRGINFCNNKIYLAPQNGTKEILIYDIKKRKVCTKEISDKYFPEGPQHNLFIEIVRFHNKLYFIPGRYKAIICLDVDTYEMFYIDRWYNNIEKDLLPEDNNFVIFNGVTRIDESRVLVNGWKSNVSLVLDLKDACYKVIDFDNIGRGLRGAAYNDDIVYLTYKNGEGIYIQDMKNHVNKKIGDLHGRVFLYQNKTYVVDAFSREIYKFEYLDADNYEKVYVDSQLEKDFDTFFMVKQHFSKLIISCSNKNKLIIFDMASDVIFRIDTSKLESYAARIQMNKGNRIFEENMQLSLEGFILLLGM